MDLSKFVILQNLHGSDLSTLQLPKTLEESLAKDILQSKPPMDLDKTEAYRLWFSTTRLVQTWHHKFWCKSRYKNQELEFVMAYLTKVLTEARDLHDAYQDRLDVHSNLCPIISLHLSAVLDFTTNEIKTLESFREELITHLGLTTFYGYFPKHLSQESSYSSKEKICSPSDQLMLTWEAVNQVTP